MPLDVRPQLPGDVHCSIGVQLPVTIRDRRHFAGYGWLQIALAVEGREALVEDPCMLLGAASSDVAGRSRRDREALDWFLDRTDAQSLRLPSWRRCLLALTGRRRAGRAGSQHDGRGCEQAEQSSRKAWETVEQRAD